MELTKIMDALKLTDRLSKESGMTVEGLLKAAEAFESAEENSPADFQIPETKPFVDCSVAEISEIMKSREVPSSWKIGDSKMVGDLKVTIIDFNKNRYADGSVAPVTFMGQMIKMERMNLGMTNKCGWKGSELRERLQPGSDLFEALPGELRRYIAPTIRYTGSGCEEYPRKIVDTKDFLWLFSETEVFGEPKYSFSEEKPYCTQYDFFKEAKNREMRDTEGNVYWWLLRSPFYHDDASFSDTPTAKARWVLDYADFRTYSKAYKTNLFHQDFRCQRHYCIY